MVACPDPLSMEFSRPKYGVGSPSLLQGSSQTSDQTQVSCIAGGFLTICAQRHRSPKTPIRRNNCSNYFDVFVQDFAPGSVRIGKYPVSFLFPFPQWKLYLCVTLRLVLFILLSLHFITSRHYHHHPSQWASCNSVCLSICAPMVLDRQCDDISGIRIKMVKSYLVISILFYEVCWTQRVSARRLWHNF